MISAKRTFGFFAGAAIAVATAAIAAPPAEKGGGKGGSGDPPAAFEPAIGYKFSGRNYTDIRLANRAGDQACTVLRLPDGSPSLRGFVFDGANGRLAYGLEGDVIYLATLTYEASNPSCPVALAKNTVAITPLTVADPETLDFSPRGDHLVWSEPNKAYTGYGSAFDIVVFDIGAGEHTRIPLEKWGTTNPDWGVTNEWVATSTRFSPDFDNSGEIIFSGAPLSGVLGAYNSLFAVNVDGQTEPRLIVNGASMQVDAIVTVTSPGGSGAHKVAFTDNNTGKVRQHRISDGGLVASFSGDEPAYSCDNSELIHSAKGKGGKPSIYITAADGSSSETWSSGGPRFFDWFCD
ncbi:hypothetical protein N0B51_14700 [Tsuneonella sp. YG55]|uniref:Translocation protein TolB n=1 Tax=Tsuneonella litorea TaxID=2976475 RepID=A0A9X2W553_9SPHN|nr:hypothetical protein [Tsuneonella litorea]MCT2560230.1 hypothetical protein [Tsuneonella litorea]